MHEYREIIDYYEQQVCEDERMIRHPFQFVRCKEIISRYLTKPNMRIADLGGATGVFSYWLAAQGHDVHLLDLTPMHIEQARFKARRLGVSLTSYTCADARVLPYKDNFFDLVLHMGALYHLPDREDRIDCLAEAYRVLKPGGIAVCKVISRYASMLDGFLYSFIEDPEYVSIMESDIVSGNHRNANHRKQYFTTAYFHTVDEIMAEMKEADLEPEKVMAVEGFTNMLNADEMMKDEAKAKLMLEFVRKTESVKEMLGVSAHVMVVGRKQQC